MNHGQKVFKMIFITDNQTAVVLEPGNSLEVDAEGIDGNEYQVFEVAWNGKWSEDKEEMGRNLIIQEVIEGINKKRMGRAHPTNFRGGG